MEYTFLSNEFYNDYPHEKYEQLELKDNRPYIHVKLEMYGYIFCVPLRSNIKHPHALFTNKREKHGVDFSKTVVITNDKYIDNNTKVFLRDDEFRRLRGKDYIIKNKLKDYIDLYKQAKFDMSVDHREDILKCSSLQYFEDYIFEDTHEAAATSEQSDQTEKE